MQPDRISGGAIHSQPHSEGGAGSGSKPPELWAKARIFLLSYTALYVLERQFLLRDLFAEIFSGRDID